MSTTTNRTRLPRVSVGNYLGVDLTYLRVKAVERMFNARMMDDTVSGIFFACSSR